MIFDKMSVDKKLLHQTKSV